MADEFVGSHLKPKNGYGQNGFQGASSDLPGEKTTSDFLPDAAVPKDDWQTRKVDATPIKAHPGMTARSTEIGTFPTSNVRKATERAPGGNYQR